MSQTVQAIYEKGKLTLLSPIILTEGERVEITVLSAKDRLRALLGEEAVAPAGDTRIETSEEQQMLTLLREQMSNVPSLSQAIIEERHEQA